MKRRSLFLAMRRAELVRIPEPERSQVLCRAAMKHYLVAGPRTHVYMRTSNGQPDAVVLMFRNAIPEAHHKHIEYIPALDYLRREGYEVLATLLEAQ